jgi:hypothetical protein
MLTATSSDSGKPAFTSSTPAALLLCAIANTRQTSFLIRVVVRFLDQVWRTEIVQARSSRYFKNLDLLGNSAE